MASLGECRNGTSPGNLQHRIANLGRQDGCAWPLPLVGRAVPRLVLRGVTKGSCGRPRADMVRANIYPRTAATAPGNTAPLWRPNEALRAIPAATAKHNRPVCLEFAKLAAADAGAALEKLEHLNVARAILHGDEECWHVPRDGVWWLPRMHFPGDGFSDPVPRIFGKSHVAQWRGQPKIADSTATSRCLWQLLLRARSRRMNCRPFAKPIGLLAWASLRRLPKNVSNDPGAARTCNLWLRRPTPYPLAGRASDRRAGQRKRLVA